MKTTALILIFSGLIGLNKCSSEINVEFPIFLNDKNPKKEEIDKSTQKNDTISISSNLFQGIFVPQSYTTDIRKSI